MFYLYDKILEQCLIDHNEIRMEDIFKAYIYLVKISLEAFKFKELRLVAFCLKVFPGTTTSNNNS